MSGCEPAEVWKRHGRPVRFAWRGRIYTVIFVRDRWQMPAEPGSGAVAGRECWRVEATAIRGVPPALYELCHDPAADQWFLSNGPDAGDDH
ncbi:MAG: nucleotidyltransferase [Actinobacteria bacterium]|nr:nucleotidyltransferase [Actinomycetota bacterium]MBO0833946.1 nucleotidyltransferase [Actinomycetota bacterium]